MKRPLHLLALLGTVAILGCSDTQSLQFRGGVAVSFATRNPAAGQPAPAALTPAAFLDDTLVSGPDTLIVTQAQIVLRQIELKRLETATCNVEPKPAGCEEVELGPVLVDLPLDSGAQQRFSIAVPAGTYSRIDFEIHKVSGGDPSDADFLAAHPDFADVSIRVDGTFNGQAFTFITDVDDEQELTLNPALTVTEASSTNVTIRVGLDGWFRTASGQLVNPATANKGGQNESLVTENIKQSLEAFEDKDRDGDERDG